MHYYLQMLLESDIQEMYFRKLLEMFEVSCLMQSQWLTQFGFFECRCVPNVSAVIDSH